MFEQVVALALFLAIGYGMYRYIMKKKAEKGSGPNLPPSGPGNNEEK